MNIANDACIAFATDNYLPGIVADLTPYYLSSGLGGYTGITSGFLRLPVNGDQRESGIFTPGTYSAAEDTGFWGLEAFTNEVGFEFIAPVTKTRVGLGTTNFGITMQFNCHAPTPNVVQWFGLPKCSVEARNQTDYLWANSVGISSGMLFWDQTSERMAYLGRPEDFTSGYDASFRRVVSSKDIFELVGIATVTTNTAYQLGTFTGGTITNNTTIKNALQQLETEVETKASSASVPTTVIGLNSVNDITGNSNKTVDAAVYNKIYWTAAFSNNRDLNISNLTAGREITVWIRNTGTQENITVQASTSTSGYGDVKLADDDTNDGSELTTFTLGDGTGSNGIAEVHVINIGGNFIGHVIGNV